MLKIQGYPLLDKYLNSKRHPIYNYDLNTITNFIDDPIQKEYLNSIPKRIKNITSNTDEQAKIAISLVQLIPYDTQIAKAVENGDRSATVYEMYPYQVLYQEKY